MEGSTSKRKEKPWTEYVQVDPSQTYIKNAFRETLDFPEDFLDGPSEIAPVAKSTANEFVQQRLSSYQLQGAGNQQGSGQKKLLAPLNKSSSTGVRVGFSSILNTCANLALPQFAGGSDPSSAQQQFDEMSVKNYLKMQMPKHQKARHQHSSSSSSQQSSGHQKKHIVSLNKSSSSSVRAVYPNIPDASANRAPPQYEVSHDPSTAQQQSDEMSVKNYLKMQMPKHQKARHQHSSSSSSQQSSGHQKKHIVSLNKSSSSSVRAVYPNIPDASANRAPPEYAVSRDPSAAQQQSNEMSVKNYLKMQMPKHQKARHQHSSSSSSQQGCGHQKKLLAPLNKSSLSRDHSPYSNLTTTCANRAPPQYAVSRDPSAAQPQFNEMSAKNFLQLHMPKHQEPRYQHSSSSSSQQGSDHQKKLLAPLNKSSLSDFDSAYSNTPVTRPIGALPHNVVTRDQPAAQQLLEEVNVKNWLQMRGHQEARYQHSSSSSSQQGSGYQKKHIVSLGQWCESGAPVAELLNVTSAATTKQRYSSHSVTSSDYSSTGLPSRESSVSRAGVTDSDLSSTTIGTSVSPDISPSRRSYSKIEANLLLNDIPIDDTPIDTNDLCKKITQELKARNIHQTTFAEKILGRSQGTLSDILRSPKQWENLKPEGRATYRRFHDWLALPLNERLDCLESTTEILGTPPIMPPPMPAQNKRLPRNLDLDDGRPVEKKARLVFTDNQKRTLQACLERSLNPSSEIQRNIAEQLNLSQNTVFNYYANARRRSHFTKRSQEPTLPK